jgi:ribosomal protein S18 acetylase RimI-like enzyme
LIVQELSKKYIDQFVIVVDEYRKFCGFDSSPDGTKEFFLQLQIEHKAVASIAPNENDQVMGFANLYPSYSTLALKKIWILNDLGVSCNFRRLGVAQALLKKATEFAKKSGAIRIELKTEKANSNAQELYFKIGFKIDQDNIYYRVPKT